MAKENKQSQQDESKSQRHSAMPTRRPTTDTVSKRGALREESLILAARPDRSIFAGKNGLAVLPPFAGAVWLSTMQCSAFCTKMQGALEGGHLPSRIDVNGDTRSWFSGKLSTFLARNLQRHACYST